MQSYLSVVGNDGGTEPKLEVLRFVVLGSAYPSRGKESADLFQRGMPC